MLIARRGGLSGSSLLIKRVLSTFLGIGYHIEGFCRSDYRAEKDFKLTLKN